MIRNDELREAIQTLRLSGRPVCIHSSLRSFGTDVENGAEGVVSAFLQERCTVLVPTFSWTFSIPPPPDLRPRRNGFDYGHADEAWRTLVAKRHLTEVSDEVYTPETSDIDLDMGAIPRAVLGHAERVRGNHPLNSFTAVGSLASPLVRDQRPSDVYAPLEALASANGAVLLMGVGLECLTLVHAAEKRAGRKMFRRWAKDQHGEPMAVEVGGCSRGFARLLPTLASLASQVEVRSSRWIALSAGPTLEAAANAIRRTPSITHCDDPACERCNDAALGGPLV